MIRPGLSEREARAAMRALEFTRVYLAYHEVSLAGASLADIAAAQVRIATAFEHGDDPGANSPTVGVREGGWERGSWDPRSAGPQLISGGA